MPPTLRAIAFIAVCTAVAVLCARALDGPHAIPRVGAVHGPADERPAAQGSSGSEVRPLEGDSLPLPAAPGSALVDGPATGDVSPSLTPGASEEVAGSSRTRRGRPELVVEVVDPIGRSDQHYWLRLVPAPRFDPSYPMPGGAVKVMDAEKGPGSYVWHNVERGDWVVVAGRTVNDQPALPYGRVSVKTFGDDAHAQIAIPPPDPATLILVRCLGPDDQLLEVRRFHFNARTDHEGMFLQAQGQVIEVTDDRVHWVARPSLELSEWASPEQRANAKLYLSAEHPRFGGAETHVDFDAVEATLRFEHPAFVDVQLDGEVDGVYQFVARSADQRGNAFGRTERLDPDGPTRGGPIAPGRYELSIRGKPSGPQGVAMRGRAETIATATVSLAAGDNAATLKVPALHDVVVNVQGLRVDEDVRLIARSPGIKLFRDGLVSKDYRVLFEALPEGTYEINGGGQTMEFLVPPLQHTFDVR